MKLPRHALIARKKVTDYLLTLRVEDDKSTFLALAGYSQEHADRLLDDLRALLDGEAEFLQATDYGDKFRIRGRLVGPNGRTLHVVSIWMTEEATRETKFLTLYPDKT